MNALAGVTKLDATVSSVHAHAPQAKLCFNQLPSDIGEAVKRWV